MEACKTKVRCKLWAGVKGTVDGRMARTTLFIMPWGLLLVLFREDFFADCNRLAFDLQRDMVGSSVLGGSKDAVPKTVFG